MAKKTKKSKRRPNISPLSVLRPRLDGLFVQPDWTAQEADAIEAALTARVAGIDPEQYLPILVKAVNNAPESIQLKLDKVLPGWLQHNDLTETFAILVQRGLLEGRDYEVAVAWLTEVGVELSALQIVHDPAFYSAYYGADDMGSQGVALLFWYANRQQTRVRGINILIDFNPPWDGAAKDLVFFPQRTPQEAIREFVGMWENHAGGITLEELDAVSAKQQILEILVGNQTNEIRLHSDFIQARELLAKHLFALPDGPDTPLLTIEDFDELCYTGVVTESLRDIEQRVGRLVRGPDGTQILVGADMFPDEDDFAD